jgi:IS5 family transposase
MATDDFLRARLDQLIKATLAPAFAHWPRPGKVLTDCDLFGTTLELADPSPSIAGRPRLPIRLMVAPLY